MSWYMRLPLRLCKMRASRKPTKVSTRLLIRQYMARAGSWCYGALAHACGQFQWAQHRVLGNRAETATAAKRSATRSVWA